jgi:Domain of unknown function (DUF4278)
MQLSYRGVSYEFNPSDSSSIPGEVIGKYRGAVLRSQHCTTSPVPQQIVNLKYRGISYQSVANYSFKSVNGNAFAGETLAIIH